MEKIFGIILFASFFVAGTASAQTGMMNSSGQGNVPAAQSGQSSTTISVAMQDIYRSQNTPNKNKLNCAKVTDTQFERLGDAAMGYGITEQQHAAMEDMMGGEGSATVKQAHINMGRSYLGCWANYNSGPMTMMGYLSGSSTEGYAHMGSEYGDGWGMMESNYSGYHELGWVTMILVWIVLLLGIIALVKWLKKNT